MSHLSGRNAFQFVSDSKLDLVYHKLLKNRDLGSIIVSFDVLGYLLGKHSESLEKRMEELEQKNHRLQQAICSFQEQTQTAFNNIREDL